MDETERESQRWIAYELHDGLLQWMVGARMQLEVAIGDADPAARDRKLKHTQRYIELAIEEGRALIGFLEQPTQQGELDFAGLLQAFTRSMGPLAESQQQQILVSLPAVQWPSLPQAVIWNLLRISQQAVRNAVEHAGPAVIRIEVGRSDDGCLLLSVSDDGVGYDLQRRGQPAAGHFGVSSMQHRARLVGGTLEIFTSPGEGCRVTCTVPQH